MQAGKQADKQARKQASKQASNHASKHALGRHSVGAMPWRGLLYIFVYLIFYLSLGGAVLKSVGVL